MSSGIGAAAEVLVNLYLNDHRPKTQATSPDLVRMRTLPPSPTDTGSGLPGRVPGMRRGWPGPLLMGQEGLRTGRVRAEVSGGGGGRGLCFL